MKIGNKELFSTKIVTGDVDKFIQKIEESEKRISQLEKQLVEIEEQVNFAITNDILSDGQNKTQVANIMARKNNIQSQLEVERLTLKTIKDLNAKQLRSAIPELHKQFKEDIQYFQSTAEDELFRQLSGARKEMERILLLLEEARSQAEREVFRYGILKNSAGYSENEYSLPKASNGHNNPTVPYRRNPAYGMPILNMTDLRAIRQTIQYNYVESNNLIADKSQRVPKPEVTKEDLQNFLDDLAE